MVRPVEDASIPTVIRTVDRTILIGHQDVPKDCRLFRIYRDDFRTSMKRTSSLIEIDSAGHVRWDDGPPAARLRNGIYLDCECHGNPHRPECVGECDCLRSTPAVPVDNDCRFPLFVGGENPITVRVEHSHHLMKSLPSMVVTKHYSFDEGVAIAKVGGELHLRVLRIVLADKASNKPNNDHLPTNGPGRREIDPPDRDLRVARCGQNSCVQDQS